MLAALHVGHVQDMIAKTAEVRAKSIATLRQELTGVSAFPILGDDGVKVEPWPQPPGLAVSNKAAITVTPLKPHRLGEAFEALRDAADAHGGYDIFVASMGEIVDHNVRSTWMKNYFAAGGIKALISDGYKTPEEAAAALQRLRRNSGVHLLFRRHQRHARRTDREGAESGRSEARLDGGTTGRQRSGAESGRRRPVPVRRNRRSRNAQGAAGEAAINRQHGGAIRRFAPFLHENWPESRQFRRLDRRYCDAERWRLSREKCTVGQHFQHFVESNGDDKRQAVR